MGSVSRRRQLLSSRLQSRRLTEMRQILEVLAAKGYTSDGGVYVDLEALLSRSLDGTLLIDASVPRIDKPVIRGGGSAHITSESTLEAALRACQSGGRVAVLNFASAVLPGGSWHAGVAAQEEDLIRASLLLECLEFAGSGFYEAHKRHGEPLYADVLLYTPEVPFIRNQQGSLLDSPVTMDVLTLAAPNLALADRPFRREVLYDVYVRRLWAALDCARRAGNRSVILGAWGCGAYENDPELVAHACDVLLEDEFASAFANVVFAIGDRDGSLRRVFERVIGSTDRSGS